MTNRGWHTRGRRWWAGALLLALALRAYVPVGFMPGSSPFVLQVCSEGISSPQHAHHSGHGSGADHGAHEHFAHCPFGSVSASGPLSQPVKLLALQNIAVQVDFLFTPELRTSKSQRAHPPRGPPILA